MAPANRRVWRERREERMDGEHFDRWTRRTFGLAVSGMAATLLGLTANSSDAKKKHKRKTKKKKKGAAAGPSPVRCPASCPACQQCVNSQSCTPAPNGGVCQNNACKSCQGGSCVNSDGILCEGNVCKSCQGGACVTRANGAECGVCRECQAGNCVNKADGATCNGTGKCLNGGCTPAPNCIGAAQGCTIISDCCGGTCSDLVGGICPKSSAGERCITNADCDTGLSCNINFLCA
jgi:hypothetical protein